MFDKTPIFSQALEFEFVFESYGVRVKIQSSSPQLLAEAEGAARKALLDNVAIIENKEAEHVFRVTEDGDGVLHLGRNDDEVSYDSSRPRFFKFFDSLLRITVAEHAQGRVFVHAGVVGWKGKAIVVPANSFRGKSTLVAELIRNGADYYSDEYAILDAEGRVHPFPRDIALRYVDADGTKEVQVNPRKIGETMGVAPIPIGLVLFTEYADGALWEPEELTIGRGVMEMIPHAIPRHFNPKFTLKVLNTALSDAIILKSYRGEASLFAVELLHFFDKLLNLAKIT